MNAEHLDALTAHLAERRAYVDSLLTNNRTAMLDEASLLIKAIATGQDPITLDSHVAKLRGISDSLMAAQLRRDELTRIEKVKTDE